MNNRIFVMAVLMAGATASLPAAAQTIWRCGDSYSQTPCPGGVAVPAADARSAGQRAQTMEAAQRDAKTGDAMEKDRLKQESKAAPAYIPPTKVDAPVTEKKLGLVKPKKPEYFTAVSPRKPSAAPKKKKKKPTKES